MRHFRWLPRHGLPRYATERLAQRAMCSFAHLPVYTAVVTTLTLVVVWVTR